MPCRILLGSFVVLLGGLASLAQDTTKGEFPLTTSPVKRFGSNQLRHGSRIQCLLFAPKGAFADAPNESLLIAGGGNDPVRIWNPTTGQRVRSIDFPWAQALAWNSKDNSLVAGSVFRNLRVVNQGSGKDDVKHDNAPAALKALAIGPDGKPILAGCQDGQLLMYFPSNRKAVHVLGHKGEVNAVAATKDKTFASGGGDRTIVVWRLSADAETLDKVKTFIAPGMVHALAFTPDGETLISAGDDRAIRLWDLKTGRVAHSLEGHKDTVVNLALSSDGKTLVSTSHDETAIVWDLPKRAKVQVIPLRFGDVDALALSPDAKSFAVAGGNNVIRLFDVETGKERVVGPGPQTPLVKVAYLACDDKLATLSAAGDLHQWDAKTAAPGKSWSIKTTPFVQQDLVLVSSPDARTLLTGSSAHPDVELWDAASGKSLGSLSLPAKESLTSATFSPSGKTIGLGFRSGLVHLVDWPGRDVRVKVKAAGPVQRLAFCGETPVFATASAGKVQIWDAPTGQLLRHFFAKDDLPESQQPAVADLAFSPDGKTLAVSGYDGVIRFVDWTTGRFLVSCEGHTAAAPSIAFSPDGRVLASASFDKTVRLWESFTGKPIETFKEHDGPVASVAFAPNGRTLYSAGADARALAWDPTTLIVDDPQNAKIDAAKLPSLWNNLAAENGHVGQGAAWRLVAAPKDAAPFLGSQVYLLDPKKVDQLFRELDAKEFPIREKATQELEKYGRWMEGRIESALKDPPSLEVKRRLERMLGMLRTGGSASLRQERLRTLRVLQVLEQIGDQPATKVLDDLARGAAEPELQREAELALKRLQKRAG